MRKTAISNVWAETDVLFVVSFVRLIPSPGDRNSWVLEFLLRITGYRLDLNLTDVPNHQKSVLVNMMVDMPSIGESSRVSGSDAKLPLTCELSGNLLERFVNPEVSSMRCREIHKMISLEVKPWIQLNAMKSFVPSWYMTSRSNKSPRRQASEAALSNATSSAIATVAAN